jgi:hypothetical protein
MGKTKIPADSAEKRDGFSEEKFVERFNLGEAVAGNFYLADNHDYEYLKSRRAQLLCNSVGNKT